MTVELQNVIDITQHTLLPKGKRRNLIDGQHLYPGFIDAHGHLFGYARTLSTVNLVGAKSKEECIERIRAYINPSKRNLDYRDAAGIKTTGQKNLFLRAERLRWIRRSKNLHDPY
jgi:imidazolonepropionase-like amidohydrolase